MPVPGDRGLLGDAPAPGPAPRPLVPEAEEPPDEGEAKCGGLSRMRPAAIPMGRLFARAGMAMGCAIVLLGLFWVGELGKVGSRLDKSGG